MLRAGDRNRVGEMDGDFQVTCPDHGLLKWIEMVCNPLLLMVTECLLGKLQSLSPLYLLFSSPVKWKELLLIFNLNPRRFNYMRNWKNGKKCSGQSQD